jgi:fibronectin-binding autotransporter adhesin
VSAAAGTFDISGTSSGATITTLNGVTNSHVTLGGQTLTISNGSTTYAGIIQGSGGLTVAGGTQTLSGANTYTGATNVTAGTLQAGATTTFAQNSAHTIASGATLSLNNFTQTIGSLAGAGTVTNGGAANRTLTTGGDNTSTEFSGVIQNGGAGTLGLTKNGSGTFTLSGSNTYTGTTTVSAGTLQVGNGGTTGSVAGNITDNAALVINRSDTLTY